MQKLTRSLVACLAVSTAAAMAAFAACLVSGGGLLAAFGLYFAIGSGGTLLLTSCLAALRMFIPARVAAPAGPRTQAYA